MIDLRPAALDAASRAHEERVIKCSFCRPGSKRPATHIDPNHFLAFAGCDEHADSVWPCDGCDWDHRQESEVRVVPAGTTVAKAREMFR